MKKKVLSALLIAAMTASMVAGCGTASNDDDAKKDDKNSEAEANPVDTLIKNTTGTVDLTVWASEEDQDLTKELIEGFKSEYKDVSFNISLGSESESTAKDTVLTDVEAAADVYAFADDQINQLVQAGALQEVSTTYTFDVASENAAGSVEAATVNEKLYAYPMTADNGYFMFYDASVFTEDDVQSLDKMVEVAKAAGKKIAIDVSNGWYIYAFFQGAGLEAALADDGLTCTCNWNAEGGADVAQAIMDLYATGVLVDLSDEEQATQLAEGTICACVNGTWRAETASEAWGENYAATKLPTFKVGDKDVQMASYSGYKLIGVNPYSKNLGWAMLLAEYLTNQSSQETRYAQRGLGPSNNAAAASDAVQADPAIAALAAQAAYATPQRIGDNFWTPAETLGALLASGDLSGATVQEVLDTAVEGITASVEK